MIHKIRGLCISFEPYRHPQMGLCRILPGAVDLSEKSVNGIQVVDDSGNVLGCVGDALCTARLEEVKRGDYGLLWDGVIVELTNLNDKVPADRAAIVLAETGPTGFRVSYDNSVTQSKRTRKGHGVYGRADQADLSDRRRPRAGDRPHCVPNFAEGKGARRPHGSGRPRSESTIRRTLPVQTVCMRR